MARGRKSGSGNGSAANLGFEATLWATADKLRGHMDASEYKHTVLGLIFLRHISDVLGFCKSVTISDIRKHGHVLTPGRYVGAEEVEDDGEPFDEKMKRLTALLGAQQAEAFRLDKAITANLKGLGF